MSTEPIEHLVGREVQPDVKQLFDRWSDYLDEIVAFGSHIFKWVGDSNRLGGDEEMPVLLTFRNILELVDSIAIQLRQSSIDPCKLQLRAMLESLFVIKFIIEKDTKRRAYNFLVCHYHEKLSFYRSLNPETPQGRQFYSELDRSQYGSKMKWPVIPDLQERIDNLEKLLKKPEYVQSEIEYQKLRNKRKGKPLWYALNNGPKSIVELADHLNLSDMYNILYRQFSRNIHGQDIIDNKLDRDSSGYARISQIRHPKHAQIVCQFTILISLNIFSSVIDHYIPREKVKYQEWYSKEIRKFLNDFSTKPFLDVKK